VVFNITPKIKCKTFFADLLKKLQFPRCVA
jgi:hypothetical protein